MVKRVALLWFSIHLLMSCAGQQQSSSDKPYYESLLEVRPRVTVPVDSTPISATNNNTTSTVRTEPVAFNNTVNEKVDVVLDSIDRFNLMRRSVDGFTIQIYSGQNREEAMNTKKKLSNELPDLLANLQYQQPKFRVTAGKYFTKLEAYPDLSRLRTVFPTAILVPEKVLIK